MQDNYIPEDQQLPDEILPEMQLLPEPEIPAELPIAEEMIEEAVEDTVLPDDIEPDQEMPEEPLPELTPEEMAELPVEEEIILPVEEDPETALIEELIGTEEIPGEDEALFAPEIENEPEYLLDEEFEDTPAPIETFDDGGEFQQMFEKKEVENAGSKKERPARKGRPRRPKGSGLLGIPQLLAAIVWLLIILAIGVSLGRVIWVCAADVLAFGREPKDVTISITSSDTMETIIEKLQENGLIKYPELFSLYADLTDAEEKLITGTFTLNTVYDYHALVNAMSTRGNRAIVEDLVIPEGFTCRQIFARLEDKGVCSVAELEEWAANGELDDYWFLEGIERGDKYCLEGFLFPDTYDFYENSTPKEALEKLLDGFDYRFSEEMRAQVATLNETLTEMMRKNGESEEYIAAHLFTERDVVIVASLIEKETANNDESPRIASVIYNRLFSWGSNPRFLNIDASVIYALDGKTDLTSEDMTVDHPYNTYVYTGLTPGPISNPGLASLKAALSPESTSYYYYVLNPSTGTHQFSKNYEDHLEWIEKFRGE